MPSDTTEFYRAPRVIRRPLTYSPSDAADGSTRLAHCNFGPSHQIRCRDLQDFRDLYHDIWTLDTAFHQTDERSIQPRSFSELLLRYSPVQTDLAQYLA